MATTRPAVLVFQEFVTLSSTPATPDLNCLIAGPAYQIMDFPDKRTEIKLTTNYGTKNAAATGSSVAPVGDDVITLAAPPALTSGALVDAASVRIFFDKARVELKHGTDGAITLGSPVMTTAAAGLVTAGVQAGDWAILTKGAVTQVFKVRTVAAGQLTFTDDVGSALAGAGTTGVSFRVERELTDLEIDASYFDVAGNGIDLNGGVTLAVSGVAKNVSYAEVYVAYRALRQDLARLQTVNSVTEIPTKVGIIDARNPLAVGLFVALSNSSTPIQAFGVLSDDLVGYTAMKSSIANRKDIYAVVPMTQSSSVVAMLNTEFVNLADPDYVVTNGVSQKFRIVIAAPTALPTTETISPASSTGDAETNGSALSSVTTLVFPSGDLIAAGVQPGDKLTISSDTASPVVRDGTYTVAHVNSTTQLELDEAIPGGADTGNATVSIFVGQSATPRSGYSAAAFTGLISQADDALYLDLVDASATFVDSGVLPGDFIEMPVNPTQTSFASSVLLEVATVVSNQRLRIVNNGKNTSTLDKELPHGASRAATVTTIPTTATLTYRVVRQLDKDGQVTALVAVASSFASRRTTLVWPDSVVVTDLVDGSLARAVPTTPAAAGNQPGFYLAAAVGALVASLPSHHGLTNLGIAGIDTINNSNLYFDDRQITRLSNGGWLLFQQENEAALPAIVHQVTTDVSTVEFAELSMVKNFDFVSIYFADIVDDFIGTWNINEETLGFITSALQAGVDDLKSRRRVRIGAPILDGRLTSVAASEISSDRVETYLEIVFPRPLNTVGLHLVSTSA